MNEKTMRTRRQQHDSSPNQDPITEIQARLENNKQHQVLLRDAAYSGQARMIQRCIENITTLRERQAAQNGELSAEDAATLQHMYEQMMLSFNLCELRAKILLDQLDRPHVLQSTKLSDLGIALHQVTDRDVIALGYTPDEISAEPGPVIHNQTGRQNITVINDTAQPTAMDAVITHHAELPREHQKTPILLTTQLVIDEAMAWCVMVGKISGKETWIDQARQIILQDQQEAHPHQQAIVDAICEAPDAAGLEQIFTQQ